MADAEMTNEESYHFDAFGYLIVRNALWRCCMARNEPILPLW